VEPGLTTASRVVLAPTTMERVDGLKDKELFPVALARGRLEKPKKTIARMVRRAIDLAVLV
jgi:hypothetical protein